MLYQQFHFIYNRKLDKGLTEHELDHVVFGKFEGEPQLNPEEVAAYKWVNMQELKLDIQNNPLQYTEWFKICFDEVFERSFA